MSSLILKAARFAAKAHAGQTRKHGHKDRPYMTHLIRVAGRVATLPDATEEMVAAAWLHDTIEDTDVTYADFKELFGVYPAKSISTLVWNLTNPSKAYPDRSRAERKKMDREHLIDAPIDAKIIKLVDRIDNVQEALDDPQTPDDWFKMYKKETRLLLDDALTGVDDDLESELLKLLEN